MLSSVCSYFLMMQVCWDFVVLVNLELDVLRYSKWSEYSLPLYSHSPELFASKFSLALVHWM